MSSATSRGDAVRLSEILGREVVDDQGAQIGTVVDVRAVQDGPVQPPGVGASLRIDGLVVGKGGLGVRLGFHRLQMRGPWPLTALFGRLEGRSRYVEWERVVSCDDSTIRIRGSGDELGAPPPVLPRPADQRSST